MSLNGRDWRNPNGKVSMTDEIGVDELRKERGKPRGSIHNPDPKAS